MSRKGFFAIGRLPSVLQSRCRVPEKKRAHATLSERFFRDNLAAVEFAERIHGVKNKPIFSMRVCPEFFSLSIYVQLPTRGMKIGTTKYPPSLRADCCYSNRTFGPVGNLKKRLNFSILNFRDKRGSKGRSSRAEAPSVLTSVRNGTRFASPAEEKCHLRARARLLTPVSS